MQSARLRLGFLIVTAVLFFGWIGYLAFLVWHRPAAGPPTWLDRVAGRPPLLARAPFLAADLNVLASITDLESKEITIKEVVWAREPRRGAGLEGKVGVTNLAECRADWCGPGDYLLPLLKTGEATGEVADATGLTEAKERDYLEGRAKGGLPSRSPGYDPYADHDTRTLRPRHIYPATPETLAELRQIHPAK
jgi:hypothetical protein